MSDDQDVLCGNEDCDRCHPLPRFKIGVERVQRVVYERTIKAATEAEARAIFDRGTAWPESYDERLVETIEEKPPVVTIVPPDDDRMIESTCWNNLPSAKTERSVNGEWPPLEDVIE
jgi:hypothetical protein